MFTGKVETTSAASSSSHHRAAFFRQSGWLMIANIAGGAMTFGVHFLSKWVPEAQYSIFGVLLMMVVCLPTMPLQMVFAQQTASALATNRERQLAGMIRLGWLWTFLLWLGGTVVVLLFQGHIVHRWALTNQIALWVTLLTVLMTLWTSLFVGVLQGRQDFFWMGWATILSSVIRVAAAAGIVLMLGGGATGMMLGTFIGIGSGVVMTIWVTRDLWRLKSEPFDGRGLLRQVVPLAFGFGVCQFMFTSDTMYAKAYFTGDEMAPYVAAGTLSRSLLWLVLPLASVMFPKIVHSTARAEKHNLLGIVLLGTAVLTICSAVGLCLLGPGWSGWFILPNTWTRPSRCCRGTRGR